MKKRAFQLISDYKPCGDQPKAISQLCTGLHDGLAHQTMLGVTGSGKTYTMAQIIQQENRSSMVLAPNKTLAAQLYAELKGFFPHNAVEYFVSYYDYYQPEAYVASSDTFIEKDASINAQIEQMRLSATKALLERSDVIIVATVSSIYGLGDPKAYLAMVLHLTCGEVIDRKSIIKRLANMQYVRNDMDFRRGTYRVRGDVIDVFPADSADNAIRISLFDEEVESIISFDPLTGQRQEQLPRVTIFPKTHYVTPRSQILSVIDLIKAELKERLNELQALNKWVEHQRLEQRTLYDIELMVEMGYCSGIENYSRYLSGREVGQAPPCLFDYLPGDALLFIDESHVTVPQLGAMYKGDRSRKMNLVEYGFRLPSALDNRPLQFCEFEERSPQTIYVSATPGSYELEHTDDPVELVVRPTGLLDPMLEVRPARDQVDDVITEIRLCTAKDQRVLITTLTKRMAEDLTDYLRENSVRVKYLHSDIDTVERVELIRDLRQGLFDVLVGINLLREGLDMPEVALVAIFDADKQGFLRSKRSLIQSVGRAARNLEGRAILYGDRITDAMQATIDVTNQRRAKQQAYNEKHGITPRSIVKAVKDILTVKESVSDDEAAFAYADGKAHSDKEILKIISELEDKMYEKAEELDFEAAAKLRDQVHVWQVRLKEAY